MISSLSRASCRCVTLCRKSLLRSPKRQSDSIALQVDFKHGHPHSLLNFDDVRGVADEPIRQLADVDQPVLVYTQIDKGAKPGLHWLPPRGSFIPAVRSPIWFIPWAK